MAWLESLLILSIDILSMFKILHRQPKNNSIPEKDMSGVIWILEVRKQRGRVVCLIPFYESFCGLASQLQHL